MHAAHWVILYLQHDSYSIFILEAMAIVMQNWFSGYLKFQLLFDIYSCVFQLKQNLEMYNFQLIQNPCKKLHAMNFLILFLTRGNGDLTYNID